MRKQSLPSQTTMVRKICLAFRAASAADRAVGIGWYPEAGRVASAIWPDCPHVGAGVLAAYSPRLQWAVNVAYADATVQAARTGQACPGLGLTTSCRTAWAIATGMAPLDALGTIAPSGRVTSGHKVRSFYRNIMGDTDAVTVDMWAYAVATGRWHTHPQHGGRVPADASMTATEYEAIAAAYRRAAQVLGVTPRDCQAVCWVAARGVKPADRQFHARAAA